MLEVYKTSPLKSYARVSIAVLSMAILVFVIGSITPSLNKQAYAASCTSLNKQLIALKRGSAKGTKSRKYTKAIAKQTQQINQTSKQFQRLECSPRRKFFLLEKHPACRTMRKTLRQMRRNLALLKRRSGGSISKSASQRKRKQIERAIRRNKCNQPKTRTAKRTTKEKNNNLFDRIFTEKRNKKSKAAHKENNSLHANYATGLFDAIQADEDFEYSHKKPSQDVNRQYLKELLKKFKSVKTVCVRTCDGYYFPVSYSLSRNSVSYQTSACQNHCPGTEMRLYIEPSKNKDPDKMVSTLDGTPYSELENAFSYQKAFNPNCSCNYKLRSQKKQAAKGFYIPFKEPEIIPNQTIPLTDPEQAPVQQATLNNKLAQNLKGSLNELPLLHVNSVVPKQEQERKKRPIRVIGRDFYPNQ